jgi:methionyl-tRNA formyltransferase
MFHGSTTPPVVSIMKEQLESKIHELIETLNVTNCLIMTFPWKIPNTLLNQKKCSFYNFHFGLLPELRGVDPIFEAIRKNFLETAICIHRVTDRIDKGPIVFTQKIPLNEEVTHGSLCSVFGNTATQSCLHLMQHLIQNKLLQEVNQNEEKANYYGKPSLNDVLINWNSMDRNEIHALVRACNPWNKGAYTRFNNWAFRILSFSKVSSTNANLPSGTITVTKDGEYHVSCIDEKILKIELFYTDEGYFKGSQLKNYGLKNNDRLF